MFSSEVTLQRGLVGYLQYSRAGSIRQVNPLVMKLLRPFLHIFSTLVPGAR